MKEKRNFPYFFENMDETITKEEALGFFLFASSRHLHYRKTYAIYDEMIQIMQQYSREDAKYRCAQVWAKRTLEKE